MLYKNILLNTIFLCSWFSLFAQYSQKYNLDSLISAFSTKPKYGAFAAYGLNLHFTNFNMLPNVPCCSPNFRFGSAFASEFGALFDWYFQNNLFFSGRVSVFQNDGSFTKEEKTTVIIDGVSQDGVFEHQLKTHSEYLNFDFRAHYTWDYFFWFSAGLGFSFPIRFKYSQQEAIVQPHDRGTFSNGLRVRNVYSGDVDNVREFNPYLSFGILAELPAHKRYLFFLCPELNFKYMFFNPIEGISWNSLLIRLGLAVKFREPIPPPPPPLPPEKPPLYEFPAPIEPPQISVSISYKIIDSSGKERTTPYIRTEDFVSYNMKPLLNYVFFEHNSDVIPERYIKLTPEQAQNFSIAKLIDLDVIQTYYHILNIIGKKLKESNDTKVLLVGTNSNKAEEKNNLDLSFRRANAVKNYFVSVWGIEPERISIQARNLPREASNPNEPQGDEENRRVEIITDNLKILEPVFTIDTIRKVERLEIVFYPRVKSEVEIRRWKIELKQNRELVKLFEGEGKPPDSIVWRLNDKNFDRVIFGGYLDVEFIAFNKIEQMGKTTGRPLAINKVTVDKKRMEGISDREFEFYSLILFDFGKSKLEVQHKNVLEFINRRVTPQSQVTIEGFTDSIGDEKVNKKISEKRAIEVAKWLGLQNARTFGVGESYLLYDNTLPEGRFYCRTVKITIETPINGKN